MFKCVRHVVSPWQLGVVSCKFQWHQRIAQPRKTPVLCNIPDPISCIGQVLGNFKSKLRNFRCHGNRGRTDVNFRVGIKLPGLKNPLSGATFMALCLILAELWLIFSQIPKFSLPWQQGVSDVYFNDTIILLDLENPLFGATFIALSLVLAVL